MKPLLGVAAACALFGAQAVAEPFTVDHLLAQEQLGPIIVDPTQRWLVVATQARWDSAPRFDLDDMIRLSLGRIAVFDLAAGGRPRPLPLTEPGVGYTAGPFSPSGRRLAVMRLVGHVWELGIVELEPGTVRWLGITPQQTVWGPTLAWRDDDQLIVAAQNADAPDGRLGLGWLAQERLPRQWAAAARGELALTPMGSGRYRGLWPKGPPGALTLVNARDGARQDLAAGDFVDLEVAPGGNAVAAIAEGADLQPVSDTPTTSGTLSRQRRLVRIDLTSGVADEPCPACDVLPRLLTWSDHGEALLIYARTDQGPWRNGAYWRVPARGAAAPLDLHGSTPALGKAADNADLASGVWLGEEPVFLADDKSGRRWRRITSAGAQPLPGSPAEPGRILAAGHDALLLASAGKVWRITPTGSRLLPWPASSLQPLASSPGGERLGYTPPPPENLTLTRRDADKRIISDLEGRELAELAPDESLSAVAPRRRLQVIVRRDAHGVQTVRLVSARGESRELAQVNASLAAVDFVTPVAVQHAGIDGEALTSWLFLPAEVTPAHCAPIVVIPYPGDVMATPPGSQLAPASRLLTNAQMLAARGYAVLVPSLPYRKDREPMDGLADQVLAAVDAAAAQQPVDATRLAIWGHSYGGWAAMAMATQSDRFKAIIAGAATTNLISAYGRLGPMANAVPEVGNWTLASTGWLETGQARMKVPPWRDPGRYVRNSPVLYADKITAPVLMFYGDADKDISQSQTMFAALQRQNKDAMLITYRGEGHVVLGPANVRDQYQRIFAFLAETIGPPAAAAASGDRK